ncbi:hypothetical protein JW877_04590 [bacterium]|nr:hypothetical protein [bacterium]
MARKKLPRAMKKCEREGCENTFIVRVGAKYQQKYCCSKCAALATSHLREGKVHYRQPKNVDIEPTKKFRIINIQQLQNSPVNFDSSGGKFAKLCNEILKGKSKFLGVCN